jgi:hypothetical protein
MIVGLAHPTAGRALINGAPIGSLAPDARVLGVHIESCGAHPGRSARDHLRARGAGPLGAWAAIRRSVVAGGGACRTPG